MRRGPRPSWLGLALVLAVAGVVGVQSGAARVAAPSSGGSKAGSGVAFEPFLRPPLLHPIGPARRSLPTLRPKGVSRASTVITGSITAGGAPLVVTIPSAGDTAAITFSGTAGERVSLSAFSDSILYSWFSFSGPGPSWSSGYVFTSGKFYEPVTLSATGTYTISIDPQGNTGSVSLQLYDVPADPSGSITPGGAPVSVTTTAPGQNASYSFTATQGQRVSLRVDTGTITSPCSCAGIEYVRIMNGGQTIGGTSPLGGNSWDFIDVRTLNAGTYQVVVDPPGDAYGQTTLRLYDVPPDLTSPPLVVNGGSRTITLGTPGQNALFPFHGQGGQTVTLQWSTSTISGTQYKIEDPNGNELRGTNWEPPGTASITTTLTAGTSDNYKIYVNPFADATGNVTLTLTGTSPQETGCGLSGVFFGARLAKCGSVMLNDPVNTLTGAFENQATDAALPGTGVPFDFTRSYTSSDTTVGRLGQGWTDSLSASLAIQQNGDAIVHSEDGQQVYYTKQPDGSFVGAAGALATLSLVGSNYQLVRNDQVTYTFDGQGRLTALKDRNNQGLTLTYNGSNQLTTVTDAAGRQVTFTYTGSVLTQLALPGGRTVSYGYTGNLLTSVTDLNGKVTTYTYDPGNRLTKITDPLGHPLVQNTYGSDGRVTVQKDALNNATTFSWDSATQTTTVTDARGNVWKDVYQNGVLLQRIDAQSNTTQYGFDSNLNQTSVTGPDGNQVTLGYDSKGNLTSANSAALNATKNVTYNAQNEIATITDARGKVTTYGYDGSGNLASVTVDGQTVAQYVYNAQGQLTSATDGNSKTTTYTYDANGNVASVTDPLGNKRTYTYDNAGHLLTETNPLGKTTTRTYDDAGNLKTVTDALNHVTTNDYDAQNRLIKITAPDTGVTQYTYDAVGNRLTETNPLNHVTTWTYDSDNRLASATTSLAEKTTYFYNSNGKLIKQVDPRGNVQGANPDDYATTFTYDAAGRLSTETDPLGNTTTHGYDKVGNPTMVTDAKSHTTSYAYDAQNRLTSVTAPDGGVTTYTYDGGGNVLTRVDAKNHTTTYTYDGANEQLSVTSPTGQKWTFTYDAVGNRTQMTDGSGSQTYTYDAANRLTGVTRGTNTFSYAYNLASNLTSRTYPDGTVTTYAYDNDERLSSATSGGVSTAYAYDPASHLTQTTLPSGNGYVETRTYYRAGRLTDVKNAKAGSTLSEFAVTMDAVGNPTTIVRSGAVASTTTTYTYDGDGGRLQASTGNQASKKTNYLWDVNGSPVATTDPVAQLALERDGNNALLRRYVYGARLISMTTGGAAYYYHYDNLGSVANVTNSSGASQWTEVYEPFGSIRTETKNSTSAPANFMKFTGEYQDPTGLYHLRARQYDPTTGRFLALDPAPPAERTPSGSSYAYVMNRPTVLVDPTGQIALPSEDGLCAANLASSAAAEEDRVLSATCEARRRTCVQRADALRTNVVAEARKYLGVPYVWGGSTPRGFDCSGLVQWVYGHAKGVWVGLPRTTYTQVGAGIQVPRSALKPGAIVSFKTYGRNTHDGIYIGNGKFIHAPHTGDVVKISSLSGYYISVYSTARRIIRCVGGKLIVAP